MLVCTNSFANDIFSSIEKCEQEEILAVFLAVFFEGLNMLRNFINWKIPRSEMSWTTSVVIPILEELMIAKPDVMFT
ncbi:hypothetical protein BGZ96_009071 [Linnemannia gamsii]|uniref:Uncharacterized protein n=1 Tax=Linnemannia gamsii TaxID=64522 RepID=A0ABQ7JX09_9FUNG|nr:hypothetical protein BGZ96_009071 [Linnemannia gamsii]